ncbi:hypothetical protein KBD45_04150 [Candidatus Dojkabacteria bacterium]|nr:hypothetical protein [Candidatus Dojkabacteria bacterium]
MQTLNSPITPVKKPFFQDYSIWFLLFTNLLTIWFAYRESWDLSVLVWIYWFQSVTIGIFNFIRILQLKEFSTEGVRIGDQPVEPEEWVKVFIAMFFLFHYGIFHLGYLFFMLFSAFPLILFDGLNWSVILYVLLSALFFFLNHLFSYFYNRPVDTKKQNIGTLMFYPYARIIPMHLIISYAFTSGNMVIPFLLLKTLADVIMHIVEHYIIRKGEAGEGNLINS